MTEWTINHANQMDTYHEIHIKLHNKTTFNVYTVRRLNDLFEVQCTCTYSPLTSHHEDTIAITPMRFMTHVCIYTKL